MKPTSPTPVYDAMPRVRCRLCSGQGFAGTGGGMRALEGRLSESQRGWSLRCPLCGAGMCELSDGDPRIALLEQMMLEVRGG